VNNLFGVGCLVLLLALSSYSWLASVPNPSVKVERDIKKERLWLQGILWKERQGVKASLEMLEWRCHHHLMKKMAVSITFSMGFHCSTRPVIAFFFDREMVFNLRTCIRCLLISPAPQLTDWLSIGQWTPVMGTGNDCLGPILRSNLNYIDWISLISA
jgi:hypothetical protein